MLRTSLRIFFTFLGFVFIFIIQKPVFILFYSDLFSNLGVAGVWEIIVNGLPMDFSVAGYLTIIPAILAIISDLCYRQAIINGILNAYYIIVCLLLSLIFVADLILYGYWGFRLDTTPLFYFISSPAAALASATPWLIIGAVMAVAVAGVIFYFVMHWLTKITEAKQIIGKYDGLRGAIAGTLLTALLFIPIRGGLTVSTMNLSSAYFSADSHRNHAAINPAFSLLYAATHQSDFGSQYQEFPEYEAEYLFSSLQALPDKASDCADTTFLRLPRPDICLIILESFSAKLLPVMGGDNIALRLDSIAREGLLFTQFYANSFRTDRALPAILSGWPAQPSTSIMKYARKVENLPSWPRRLAKEGYKTSYYYGGDINFTNMLAYLVSSGFEEIIRDTDFPLSQRTGKWGAHDDVLFQRAINDLSQNHDTVPRLTVIQTSSSHEPFKVPFNSSRVSSPEGNAFAFTDSCVGNFIDTLKMSPRWDRTLVILVPDHCGAWPSTDGSATERHRIPLIFTGGALGRLNATDSFIASQTDIVATVLGALGLPHDEFEFSNNLLAPDSRRQAFIADPSVITFLNDSTNLSWDCDGRQVVGSSQQPDSTRLKLLQAYLQTLYSRMASL